MKKIKYLSPSSISYFMKDPVAFYSRYLSDNPDPRDPQTKPMSVGSAFDAYVKSRLYRDFIGDGRGEYEFEAMFESQVEPHNRDWAREAGKKVFDSYERLGGLADLVSMMGGCVKPRFEFRLEGGVMWENAGEMPAGVPPLNLMGKPDMHFIHSSGVSIILDWKVNGFCASRKIYAAVGFVNRLPERESHKKSIPVRDPRSGIVVNRNPETQLESAEREWAQQLAIYGWLLGEPVGSQFICAIDQLVCGDGAVLGVAQHRSCISPTFQVEVYTEARALWALCHSDWFFRDVSREESQRRCEMLDRALPDNVMAAMTASRE